MEKGKIYSLQEGRLLLTFDAMFLLQQKMIYRCAVHYIDQGLVKGTMFFEPGGKLRCIH
jgi:hypothetical protein